jgi:hypothetical protein
MPLPAFAPRVHRVCPAAVLIDWQSELASQNRDDDAAEVLAYAPSLGSGGSL